MTKPTEIVRTAIAGTAMFLLLTLNSQFSTLHAQGTAFTYQGRLQTGGLPANGLYDFTFQVFDAMSAGNSQGSLVSTNGVGVTNGLFMVTLDFGNQFNGAARWLEIGVSTNLANNFLMLTPRQQITPAPYAITAGNVVGLQIQSNIDGAPNMIGGSSVNFISPGTAGGTVAGGGATNYFGLPYTNSIAGDFGVIGGGADNEILTGAGGSVIGGGTENQIGSNTLYGTISGGEKNQIGTNSFYSTISGGLDGQILSYATCSIICGGRSNQLSGQGSFIGGGGYDGSNMYGNIINGSASTISGGLGNSIIGSYGTIPGGDHNAVNAAYSFAAGHRAKANYPGMFVWADSQDSDFNPNLYGFYNNSFNVRVNGGILLTTGAAGANQTITWIAGQGSWGFSSDRNIKDRFEPVNAQSVLNKVSKLPLSEWSYKGYGQRHIGPMAQDFHALFPLNDSDKTLNDVDLHGVALAAIQGLNEKVEAQTAQLQQKDEAIRELGKSVAELKELIAKISQKIDAK